MGRLAGKVALITGAGNGQGASEAYFFAREGAKVIATDIEFDRLTDVVNKINAEFPNSAIALKHDVSSEEAWIQVVEEGVKTFGNINVLVNNAGIATTTPYTEVTFEAFQRTMNINAWSQLVGIRTVVPYMKQAGGGSIINIGSLASKINAGGFSAYTMSKGAVEAMTRSAAAELGPVGIRVNSVHPGGIATRMVTENKDITQEAVRQIEAALPLRRLGTADEVAHLVVFLASDESTYITGAEHIIDGGQWIQ